MGDGKKLIEPKLIGKDEVKIRFYQNLLDGMGFEHDLTINIADVLKHFEQIDPDQVKEWRDQASNLGIDLAGKVKVTKDPKFLR